MVSKPALTRTSTPTAPLQFPWSVRAKKPAPAMLRLCVSRARPALSAARLEIARTYRSGSNARRLSSASVAAVRRVPLLLLQHQQQALRLDRHERPRESRRHQLISRRSIRVVRPRHGLHQRVRATLHLAHLQDVPAACHRDRLPISRPRVRVLGRQQSQRQLLRTIQVSGQRLGFRQQVQAQHHLARLRGILAVHHRGRLPICRQRP